MYIAEDEDLRKLTEIDENSSYHEKTPFNDSQINTSNLKLIQSFYSSAKFVRNNSRKAQHKLIKLPPDS